MKRLEEDELTRLNEATKSLREARTEIADVELALNRLQTRKNAALFNAETASQDLNNIQAELQQKYGNVLIDTQTGEIKNDNADS
jgi:chromosome segregation ATPase